MIPHYLAVLGFAAAQFSKIPRAVHGECYAGQTFHITSIDQLLHPTEEIANSLPCILSAGVAPDAIPMGPGYGEVLNIVNSSMFNPLATSIWKGKVFMSTRCDDGLIKPIMYNFVGAGNLKYPAIPYIAPPSECPLKEGEPPVDGLYLNIDYRLDFDKYCPTATLFQEPYERIWFKEFNNTFPVSQILDVARIVGTGSEGQALMLGRTLLQNWATQEYETVLWFALELGPNNPIPGVGTIKVTETFDFVFPGVKPVLKTIVPNPKDVIQFAAEDAQGFRDQMLQMKQAYDLDEPINKLRSSIPFLMAKGYKDAKSMFRPMSLGI